MTALGAMSGFSAGQDDRGRYRNDESSPGAPVFVQLRRNFVNEVPGQDQQVLRSRLRYFLRGHHRQVSPRHQLTLLVGASICHELEQIRTNTAKIRKDDALGSGSVASDS